MTKMARTLIVGTALVLTLLANCQGKVVLKDTDLTKNRIDIINKNEIETDSDIFITSTLNSLYTETNNVDSIENNNKIEENDDNDNNITDDSRNFPNIDETKPLILTSMLERGLKKEARHACKVDPSLFLGFESYSGFFTVNKTYNSNVFFWYFPVENKPVNETPWIIWLQGGPGASSLIGLFEEIGPFKLFDPETLMKNPYTWLKNHSLLFIDNPIGAGFSFTNNKDGFIKDMATYSKHLFSTVQQFLQVFPELRQAPLYVTGESYAGKYVPALAMELHKHKHRPAQYVNLQGVILGNAYVDPAMIANVTQTYYYFGILEKEEMKTIEPLATAFQRDIANNNSAGAKTKWMNLISILLYITHQKQAYNFLKDEIPIGNCTVFLKKPEIKKALHVGDINFSFVNFTSNLALTPDFLSSTKPLLEKLLEHYRVLTYCGQLDLMLPCIFTSENYRTWEWSGASDFVKATRYPFKFDNKLAGYSKSGGRLTEVVVRGAGHMVPMDAPAPAQALVARWTHNETLATHMPLFERTFIQQFIANNSIFTYL